MKSSLFSEKCTTHLKQALARACGKPGPISVSGLLDALAAEHGSIAAELLGKPLKRKSEPSARSIAQAPESPASRTTLATKMRVLPETAAQSLVKAVHVSHQHGHRYIGTEHLLASILQTGADEAASWFSVRNIRPRELERNLQIVLESTAKFPDLTAVFREESEPQAKSTGKPTALEYFGRELTSTEVQKDIDPVIGRSAEIERVIHILCRRYKNNPVLLGEAGVGKTAIVEGLAKRMLSGSVPAILANKRIVSLDLGAMVAGTMYRGEFEARLKQTLETAEREGNVILFIDEMHTVIGAGAASGSLDAANMLKPSLARGGLSIIGATTLEEYKKHIEGDSALERRLAPVLVDEPNEQQTRDVLAGIRENYESYHNVAISDDALDAAVELSNRYLPDRLQPDKAIDLIDEAAARVKVQRSASEIWKRVRSLESLILDIQTKKQRAVSREQYDEAISAKAEELALRRAHASLREQTKAYTASRATVTREHVAAVVSALAKVPAGSLAQDEHAKFAGLEEALGRVIAGQNQALSEIANLIRRSRTGVSDPNRPSASFLFIGPSGVGKTETAKQLALSVFGDRKALASLDMSEYSEAYSISKLIGSPAGYVGYRDRTAFTDKVRANPYSLILLDEIEKAHPEVLHVFLQILEEGSVRDATGRLVNFRNAIIAMTTNISLPALNDTTRLGFGLRGIAAADTLARTRAEALGELKERFRPEFLNRIDSIVLFDPLTRQSCKTIVARYFGELNVRLKREQVHVTPTDASVAHIVEEGYRPDMGARGIRRFFQDQVETEIAKRLLARSAARDGARDIGVDASNNTLVFTEAA